TLGVVTLALSLFQFLPAPLVDALERQFAPRLPITLALIRLELTLLSALLCLEPALRFGQLTPQVRRLLCRTPPVLTVRSLIRRSRIQRQNPLVQPRLT